MAAMSEPFGSFNLTIESNIRLSNLSLSKRILLPSLKKLPLIWHCKFITILRVYCHQKRQQKTTIYQIFVTVIGTYMWVCACIWIIWMYFCHA